MDRCRLSFFRKSVLFMFAALGTSSASHAAMAVIDVSAVAQMVQQIGLLRSQLTMAQNQLAQARQAYQAMTGNRAMEHLLAGTVRNYLPPDWQELERVLNETSGAYAGLADDVRTTIGANAVLSPQQMAALSPWERGHVEEARRSAALQQALAREALASTSARFASIQQLIGTIPSATDQKSVLDLQARIQAEQAMLQNEQTKLQLLAQVIRAEERADEQRRREEALASIGSTRELPPMGLLTP